MAETKNTTRQRKTAAKSNEAQATQSQTQTAHSNKDASVESLREALLHKQGFGFASSFNASQASEQVVTPPQVSEQSTQSLGILAKDGQSQELQTQSLASVGADASSVSAKKSIRRRQTKKTASAESSEIVVETIKTTEIASNSVDVATTTTTNTNTHKTTRKSKRQASARVTDEQPGLGLEALEQASATSTPQVATTKEETTRVEVSSLELEESGEIRMDLSPLSGFMGNSVMAKTEDEQDGEEDSASKGQAGGESLQRTNRSNQAQGSSIGRASFGSYNPNEYEQEGESNRLLTRYSDPKYKQSNEAMQSWQQSDVVRTRSSDLGIARPENTGFASKIQGDGVEYLLDKGDGTREASLNDNNKDVYAMAYASQRVQPINLAYVQYLMKHYPFSDKDEQNAFNVILLCLFAKMQDGHICVNLESAVNLMYIVKDWVVKHQEELEKEMRHYSNEDTTHQQNPFDFFCLALRNNVPRSNEAMLHLLQSSSAVATDIESEKPLIWDLNRLYVRRYFIYEQQICNYIKSEPFVQYEQAQEELVKSMVEVLFPRELDKDLPEGMLNWQKVAALMSLVSNFTVISGGPGTGKTTTVFKLLLLLLTLDDKNRNIMMCAPTAKAAARMGESISHQLQNPRTQGMISTLCKMAGKDEAEVRALLPMQASTVHGMLKVRPHLVTPVFNENRKLTCDVLIVDEVSMLELSLFAKLIAALPQGCKLILLGDKDQLSSVGAGMVLGDICSILSSQAPNRVQDGVINFISRMSGYSVEQLLKGKIADHIALLQYSWRSKGVEGIGKLAAVFNNATPLDMHVSEAQAEQEVDQGLISDAIFERIMKAEASHEVQNADSGYYKGLLQQVDNLCLELKESDLELLTSRLYTLEYPQESKDAQLNKGSSKQEAESNSILIKCTSVEGAEESAQVDVASLERMLLAPLILHRIPEPYNKEAETHSRWKLLRMDDSLNQKELVNKEKELRQQIDSEFQDRLKQIYFRRHNLIKSWIDPRFKDNYGPFLSKLREMKFRVKPYTEDCDKLFGLMNTFKVLCSNHNDVFGDVNLNSLFEVEVLKTYVNNSGLFSRKFEAGEFYPGKIVLITENDPMLNLVNGYVGFCAYLDDDDGAIANNPNYKVVNLDARAADETDTRNSLRLFIAMGSKQINGKTRNEINVISTLLLNNYETGYAMSIHKSQGSEYDRVAIVLSQSVNPILTKELVYTGITRAKKRVELVANNKSMLYAMSHAVVRESGLAERLFGKQV